MSNLGILEDRNIFRIFLSDNTSHVLQFFNATAQIVHFFPCFFLGQCIYYYNKKSIKKLIQNRNKSKITDVGWKNLYAY